MASCPVPFDTPASGRAAQDEALFACPVVGQENLVLSSRRRFAGGVSKDTGQAR
jgi:hypothetical protein